MAQFISTPVGELRWAPSVVLALSEGPRRFNWLLGSIPGISDRMLTERLRDLEDRGLVTRKVEPVRPIKVLYELTVYGHDFVRPLRELRNLELFVADLVAAEKVS